MHSEGTTYFIRFKTGNRGSVRIEYNKDLPSPPVACCDSPPLHGYPLSTEHNITLNGSGSAR